MNEKHSTNRITVWISSFTMLHAIPHGVQRRLAKLTSRTEETESKRMDELYPTHYQALEAAGHVKESPPTLGEVLNAIEAEEGEMDELPSIPTRSLASSHPMAASTRSARIATGKR